MLAAGNINYSYSLGTISPEYADNTFISNKLENFENLENLENLIVP